MPPGKRGSFLQANGAEHFDVDGAGVFAKDDDVRVSRYPRSTASPRHFNDCVRRCAAAASSRAPSTRAPARRFRFAPAPPPFQSDAISFAGFVEPARRAANAVSAHLGLAAVGIERTHAMPPDCDASMTINPSAPTPARRSQTRRANEASVSTSAFARRSRIRKSLRAPCIFVRATRERHSRLRRSLPRGLARQRVRIRARSSKSRACRRGASCVRTRAAR